MNYTVVIKISKNILSEDVIDSFRIEYANEYISACVIKQISETQIGLLFNLEKSLELEDKKIRREAIIAYTEDILSVLCWEYDVPLKTYKILEGNQHNIVPSIDGAMKQQDKIFLSKLNERKPRIANSL